MLFRSGAFGHYDDVGTTASGSVLAQMTGRQDGVMQYVAVIVDQQYVE